MRPCATCKGPIPAFWIGHIKMSEFFVFSLHKSHISSQWSSQYCFLNKPHTNNLNISSSFFGSLVNSTFLHLPLHFQFAHVVTRTNYKSNTGCISGYVVCLILHCACFMRSELKLNTSLILPHNSLITALQSMKFCDEISCQLLICLYFPLSRCTYFLPPIPVFLLFSPSLCFFLICLRCFFLSFPQLHLFSL